MTTTTQTPHPVSVYAAELGLTLTAQFVPQSLSRNAQERTPSLNWRATLIRKGRGALFTTDYMQGAGHIPGWSSLKGGYVYLDNYAREVAEKGRYSPRGPDSPYRRPLPAPSMADVLYNLLLDAEAYGLPFEEWAGNFGFDTDSRKAEHIYHECVATGRALSRLLTHPEMDRLRDLLADY